MGRVLFLFAAIPLISAGYFVRDSDLIATATLYAEAFLFGSGATDVVRPLPSGDAVASASLPAEARPLFRETGKEPRADRVAELKRTQTVKKRPRLMVASMTPRAGADGLPNDGPANTASIERSSKGGRLDAASASQVLLSQKTPKAEAPEFDEASHAGVERASAAIFMMTPVSVAGFVDSEKVEDADPIAWPGRLHLAGLKSEEDSKLFGGFTEQEFRARELRCMSAAIYFEARSEPRQGQIAVAQVVMNRVRASAYPDTICGVIYQGQWNRNACQFSFACDGLPERPENKALWQRSMSLAKEVMRGEHWLSGIGYATHYHANYVSPRWAHNFQRVKQIGRHIFYKAPKIQVRVADNFDLNLN
ncbi:MAG: cell wall hydrolase [Dichotomicrobium sp.]